MTESAADFKAREKIVLAYLLTIPEVAAAVALQREGKSQEAKSKLRAAVRSLPPEIQERAGSLQTNAEASRPTSK